MVGDQIVTSGQDLEIPKGLLIGKVVSVENEAYQPFQQAILEPAVNLEKLIDVTIIFSY
jgi:cell shape-determining protein MreC